MEATKLGFKIALDYSNSSRSGGSICPVQHCPALPAEAREMVISSETRIYNARMVNEQLFIEEPQKCRNSSQLTTNWGKIQCERDIQTNREEQCGHLKLFHRSSSLTENVKYFLQIVICQRHVMITSRGRRSTTTQTYCSLQFLQSTRQGVCYISLAMVKSTVWERTSLKFQYSNNNCS